MDLLGGLSRDGGSQGWLNFLNRSGTPVYTNWITRGGSYRAIHFGASARISKRFFLTETYAFYFGRGLPSGGLPGKNLLFQGRRPIGSGHSNSLKSLCADFGFYALVWEHFRSFSLHSGFETFLQILWALFIKGAYYWGGGTNALAPG